jgi:hypothetical protein
MAAVMDSYQDPLSVGFPGGFISLPGRGAPGLHVFQRREFHLESCPDGLPELFQSFIQHFDRVSRHKRPHVNAPVHGYLSVTIFPDIT